ncbi:uncharacterized protein KY384_005798 [Bacidia gigantensis]|uniref:uncharacterized protein n=1 Tax=Bacidia gigantensis TaxID=2732470 RepID=UPI001D044EE5|nr:uncharacterized protein KY384_005798 [Bacidia gigantensis]KAG8529163.1 hypothetical protein KY384_005798 [Bacidia gigantensis]
MIAVPPAKRIRTDSSSSDSNGAQMVAAHRCHEESDKWFDHANNDAVATKNIPFIDNDPPFFVRRQSSGIVHGSGPKTNRSMQPTQENVGPTAPTASLLARMNATNATIDSPSEGFRGVIDDLTVQNRKLKKKLGKYERLHCSHLQNDKLFEVRIHGLPSHKKRELEDTLKSFASGIEGVSRHKRHPRKDISSTFPTSSLHHEPSTSSTSGSKPIDSAYASMSVSALSQAHPQLKNVSHSMPNDVKSFLRDIPEALMPRNCFAMSERSRSKLVARRLEQIFTGKGAKAHRQGQMQQQQEVSTAAAEADRTKIEACGQRVWREGTREAHILPDSADFKVDSMEDGFMSLRQTKEEVDETETGSRCPEVSRAASPEQRPTRPLDLDIHRAQAPSDNIDYIRHLGLASPTGEHSVMVDGDDGWVYLNLLISMAQLHTLNVTPEFIRSSVKTHSDRLELSKDGTKIKWLGGQEGTQLSSDGDESEERNNWKSFDSSNPVSKTGSSADMFSKDGLDPQAFNYTQAGTKRRLVNLETSNTSDDFHYRPLFNRILPSDEEESSDMESVSTDTTNSIDLKPNPNTKSNVIREKQKHPRNRNPEGGPIIFYNGAKFCTDLGADPSPAKDHVSYNRFTQRPVGFPRTPSAQSTDDGSDSDFSLPTAARSTLDLNDLRESIPSCASELDSPLAMEASGLGGVHPDDNFIVKVQTRRGIGQSFPHKLASVSARREYVHRVTRTIPKTTIDTFREGLEIPRSQAPVVNSEIVSAVKTDIAPSTLPPPSYVHLPFTSSSSSDDDDEDEDDDDSSEDEGIDVSMRQSQLENAYHCSPRPAAAPITPRSDTEAKEAASDSDSDDSSIDLLAHARLQDPEAVRAREMEFEGDVIAPGEMPRTMTTAALALDQDSESDVDSMSVDQESSDSGFSE